MKVYLVYTLSINEGSLHPYFCVTEVYQDKEEALQSIKEITADMKSEYYCKLEEHEVMEKLR